MANNHSVNNEKKKKKNRRKYFELNTNKVFFEENLNVMFCKLCLLTNIQVQKETAIRLGIST